MCKAYMLLVASVLVWSAWGGALAADVPNVRPDGGMVWNTQGGFAFEKKSNKKREAISGIACPPASATERRCIVAIDEGGEARYVKIGDNSLVLEPDRIVLLPDDDMELDAEGAARDGDLVYITGSFSSKRKKCEANEDSRHVFRFSVNHTTGRAELDSRGFPVGIEDDKGALWDVLKRDSVLKEFAGQQTGLCGR